MTDKSTPSTPITPSGSKKTAAPQLIAEEQASQELGSKEAHNLDEFRLDAKAMQELALSEDTLVDYEPKSKNPVRLTTKIPRNISFDVQKALNMVVRARGNVDNYVRDHLKYRTIDALWAALAAEQVDSLALYIYQFEQSQGIIIADKTGVGKGRQAAAVLRHAKLNGYIPVMFTKTTGLFSSTYRDLVDIDFADINPFILNTTSDARVYDKDGNTVFEPLSGEAQHQLVAMKKTVPSESPESIEWHKKIGQTPPDPEKQPTVDITEVIDYLPSQYDSIFCTYSQFQAAHPYKRLWLTQVVQSGVEGGKTHRKAVFVVDESHTAGGYNSMLGTWIRSVLPSTRAACYLSATPTKTAEVIPLYKAKTAMEETGLSDIAFVDAMQFGGLPLQEINASNLAEIGQFIRRERSMEGVESEYKILKDEPNRTISRERIDQLTRQMVRIVDFESNHIRPILSEIHKRAKDEGEKLEVRHKLLGVSRSPYFSKVFNIIDQALFALMVKDVANETLRLLHENKKVVIAFRSTMGVHLQDLNLVSGDIVLPSQLDFARTLLKGLDGLFEYNYLDAHGNKSRRRIEFSDLSPQGQREYKGMVAMIQEASSGLTISPLDELIAILEGSPKPSGLGGHKGRNFKVAEVTGRSQRIRFEGEDAVIASVRVKAEKAFREFNNGTKDVLFLNAAGSTGYSAHASEKFEDQRQREMVNHQFHLDISTVMQMLGRVDRTGQVIKPRYLHLALDIPQVLRLMSMLKAKLKKLDANSTGSQNSSDDILDFVDFMNEYGDEVAWKWVDENPGMARKIGNPTYTLKRNGEYERHKGKEGAMRQVTGRAALLTVSDQEKLYNDLIDRYLGHIKWEKQRGTYNLETEFVALDAEVKKRYLHRKGSGTKSPFGRDTIRLECIVNNLHKPLTRTEVDELVLAYLDGGTASGVQKNLLKRIEKDYPEMVKRHRDEAFEYIEQLDEEIGAMDDPADIENPEERELQQRHLERLQELVESKRREWNKEERELAGFQKIIHRSFGSFKGGDLVKTPLPGSSEHSWGFFIGAYLGQGHNPFTPTSVSLRFAVADYRRIVECNLSSDQRSEIDSITVLTKEITEEEKKTIPHQWNELIKEDSQNRVRRHVLVGNIVGASGTISVRNKLVKFNTQEGEIYNGILLHKDFGKAKNDLEATVPISNMFSELLVLNKNEIRSDAQLRLKMKKLTENTFQVLINKKGGKQLYTDEVLRSLILRPEGASTEELPDFVQNAGDMMASIHEDALLNFLKRLDHFNLFYYVKPIEMEEWEKENEKEWEERTKSEGEYRYELMRPYGQGSNPTSSFQSYEEPTTQHPYGVVVYARKLTDQERFKHSLIPLYRSVEEPVMDWFHFIEQTSTLNREFLELLDLLKAESMSEAIRQLGWFVLNNPHEDGNPEFVFGDFQPHKIGRAVYERTLGEISPIDELIEQFTIALQAA